MSLTSYRAAPPRVNLVNSCEKKNVIYKPGNDLLFHTLRCSTIGAEKFNGRVRDGIGFRPLAIITKLINYILVEFCIQWVLKIRKIKSIELLVPVSSICYHTSTPGLSTWWSSTVLKGNLVSRGVSRLDAFSGYPVRT